MEMPSVPLSQPLRFLTSPQQGVSNKGYVAIEGFRGILAVMVCFGHFGMGVVLESFGLPFHFHMAVDVFFVISGLVLATSNYYAPYNVSASQFFIKRLLRLYPLHFITLFIMVGIHFIQAASIPLLSFIENVFLVNNLGLPGASNAFNFPSWSISVELWSAMLFYFITRWVRNRIALAVLLLSYVVTQSLVLPTLVMGGDYESRIATLFNAGLLRGLAGMSLGVLIHLALNSPFAKVLFQRRVPVYITLSFLLWSIFANVSICNDTLFYLCVFILVGSLAYDVKKIPLLSTPLFVWMGALSYSIYLLHIPLYHFLQIAIGENAVKGVLGKCLLLPVLFCLSYIVYTRFEMPLQRLGQKAFSCILKVQKKQFGR